MSSSQVENGESSVEAGSKNKRFSKSFGKLKNGPKSLAKGPNKLVDGVGKGINGVAGGVAKVGDGLGKGLNGVAGGVTDGLNGIAGGVAKVGQGLKDGLTPDKKVAAPVAENKPKPVAAPAPKIKRKLNKDLAIFPWESIGYMEHSDNNNHKDESHNGEEFLAKKEAMQTYLSDTYFSDYYTNTMLIIGTCFFSWAVARVGWSFLWLFVVYFAVASVYRAEFRRFTRDTRDDMLRLSISDRLENESETMDWCNNLLSKVWLNYMPMMRSIVMTNVNPILAGVVPGGLIESIELAEFHLGSVAPKVTSIKSSTKLGRDTYEMTWDFGFDPNNRENMTKSEIRNQIMPKVVIKTGVGKGIVTAKVPINVENMGFVGRMRIRFTFTEEMPMIKMLKVQFLEPPRIDYALKPLTGSKIPGIDMMKLIPGLKATINGLINYGISTYLVEPNGLDLDIQALFSAQSPDASSVLSINFKDATFSSSGEYYAVIEAENSTEDKKIKLKTTPDSKNPTWNETHHLLINTIEQSLNIHFYQKTALGKNKIIGTATYDMREFYQDATHDGLSLPVELNGKKLGFVQLDLNYFPELLPPTLEDGNQGPVPESEVGILKFVLNEAKELDVSSSLVGQLSPYAEIYFNGKLKHKTRVMKRTNVPSFGDIIETLITAKSDTNIRILIKDSVGFSEDTLLGEYEGELEDILTQIADTGNYVFKLQPRGFIRLTPTWKPVALTDVVSENGHKSSLGVFRIHIRDAIDLKNLEFSGKVDPYVRITINGKSQYETIIHPQTLNPVFEEVAYIPVSSENQFITLTVYDAEVHGKDRNLGSTSFKADKFLVQKENGKYFQVDGDSKIVKAPLFLPKNDTSKGYLNYSVSFVPVTPVYTPKEIIELKEENEKIQEQLKKEQEEQEKIQADFKKNPDAYEWVEVDSPFKHRDPNKKIISLDHLISHNSGVLTVNAVSGVISSRTGFLSVLLDDYAYPGMKLGPAHNGNVAASTGDMFVRDLKNSTFNLRVSPKEHPEEPEDVIVEKSFSTLDLIKKSAASEDPIRVDINDKCYVELFVSYSPSDIEVKPSETMSDTGKITVEILNGENLKVADRNGKSDPFAILKLNDVEVTRTEIVKKTLNPEWNTSAGFVLPSLTRSRLQIEVEDWDLAGDNGEMGIGDVDLSKITPGSFTPLSVPIISEGKQEGVVNIRVLFEPQYVRPQVQKFSSGLPGISSVAKAPVKVVGGVGKGVVKGFGFLAGGISKGVSDITSSSSSPSTPKKNGHTATIPENGSISTANNTLATPSHNGTALTPKKSVMGSNLSAIATTTTIYGGAKRTAGRVSVKELVAISETYPALSIKVLVKTARSNKKVYETKSTKLVEAVYNFDEEFVFKALPEDSLIFEASVRHRLGKDEIVGTGEVSLIGPHDSENTPVEIPNVGTLMTNIRFAV